MLVVGTRPEIIKMAPVIHEYRSRNKDFIVVHTGQHYDMNMSRIFFRELEIGKPDRTLDVGSGSHAVQTAGAMVKLEKLMEENRYDLVVVQGDTNTGLAASLAAVKLRMPVAHVEAGLRSFDLRMPEEHNRRVIDHLSTLLFAPTRYSKSNLVRENVHGKIFVTGNTVIDACLRHMRIAIDRSRIMSKINHKEYALLTLHRAETVEDNTSLRNVISGILRVDFPIVFPVHPRTGERIRALGLLRKIQRHGTIQLLDPVGYLDLLMLLKNCRFVLTDSGGIQEEATAPAIRRFVIVLREKTDRPESVTSGFARIAGTSTEAISRLASSLAEKVPQLPRRSPYGDGRTARRILDYIDKLALKSHE